ncbi:MAG TPA: ATP-binding protein [Acidimicrobiales bacterium]|nr:ATP-binding protein [Acidimicrobiales bacterium]
MDPLDGLPDAVLVLDADRKVVGANQAAAALTGYGKAEMAGRALHELLSPHDDDGRALLADGWPRAANLRSVRGLPEQAVTVRRADGSELRTFVTGSYRRDAEGAVAGASLVLRDAHRRRQLAEASAEVVSTVSHELRSPLTSVKGYTTLLLNRWERIGDDDKRMMLEQIHHDADRVTRLITELLDISRMASGRLVLRRQMVDLPELITGVVEKLKMEYPDMTVDFDFPPGMPKAYADPDKLVQVVTNLVENACKYASPVGLRISASATPDDIAVSVADRGEGIPAEDLPKVFTRFFRRSEGRPTGSGLGLWISRGLVDAHGGELAVSSVPGQGSVFSFTLPLSAFEDTHPNP